MNDFTGQKFSKLQALRQNGRSPHGKVLWECKCDCGRLSTVISDKLKSGHTKSCGCDLKSWQAKGQAGRTHGLSKTPEYKALEAAVKRCKPCYHGRIYYFDRGITVCDKWRHLGDGFLNFLAHIGPRLSPKHSLDRINNDGNYEPGNVRWATWKEQRANQRPRS